MAAKWRFILVQWIWLVLLGRAAVLAAQTMPSQTSLPATASTNLLPASEASAGLAERGPKTAKAAEVSYTSGKLEIAADNSSLNQILREIQRKTGMKITGGVAEERVFGKYGPGTMAEVLTGLLDGTGSNMLLVGADQVGADQNSPAELILTPRQGSASPSSPSTVAGGDAYPGRRPEAMPQPAFQPSIQPARATMPSPASPGVSSDGTFAATPVPSADSSLAPPPAVPPPAVSGSADPGAASDANNPQSPNGVKTPQQIYQQLIRMQQLQQQQQTNPK